MDTLQPTSPSQWQRGRLETLPSGNVARLRSVGLEYFVRSGNIPDALTPAIAEEAGESQPQPLSQREILRQHMQLQDMILCAAFLEPRVVMGEASADEMYVGDIDPEDAQFVFGKYTTLLQRVEPFRQEQEAGLPSVETEPSDAPASE